MPDHPFAHERKPSLIVGHPHVDQREEYIISELKMIGYEMVGSDWMLGGSQEISLYRFERRLDALVLQAETYQDLMLFGEKNFLEEVQHLSMPIKETR
jgi:hypothetical protein